MQYTIPVIFENNVFVPQTKVLLPHNTFIANFHVGSVDENIPYEQSKEYKMLYGDMPYENHVEQARKTPGRSQMIHEYVKNNREEISSFTSFVKLWWK
jgi:hypothetical protein